MKNKEKLPISETALTMHPGRYVRETLLKPAKITVTKAANLIGITRPNVSNFLNGKVSISTEMAVRIERVFNIPAQVLLDMQTAYDAQQAKEKGTPTNTRAYVPPFLAIKAKQLENWANGNNSRSRLSVFLRILVHSTGHGLTKVDFPGNDDAERPGWDGFVEASEGTPWIPIGSSGWEFSTQKNKSKADKDFQKNVKALSSKEKRKKITFVFVTPRRWARKKTWEKEQNDKRIWKEVRVYDADNLEQWLEQSLPGQSWFANEIDMPERHVRTLDKCWSEWSQISKPPLAGILFKIAIDAATNSMQSWLKKSPEKPFIIAADSTGEGLAFLFQIFNEQSGDEFKVSRDHVIVFDKPEILPRLAQGAKTFIPVVYTQEVQRELPPYAHKMHSIIVCPRNAPNAAPNIILEPIPNQAFRKGLEEMGYGNDEICRLAQVSGGSLTVLRRQLSTIPEVRTPEWAENSEIAKSLVPFLFVGAWDSENETDRKEMSRIVDKPYKELERTCQQLTTLNDAPIWSIGSLRGVISKIDLLHAIKGVIIKGDLEQYFSLARLVLGEDDPALDLSEDERWWAAAIQGKTRKFSDVFRKGVSETLVLLAVYGKELFKSRLNIDTEIEALKLIQDLLPSPLTTRSLEMHSRNLPIYAEAAPSKFLSIIEGDLKTSNPAVLGLLRPVDSAVFGNIPSRTGLLWALENLAWNPGTLTRVALILARLAQIEIRDNWINQPMHSLKAIFQSWMPQTAANHEERIIVIKTLVKHYPDTAWKLCIAQFVDSEIGIYSHKPKWRTDGYDHGEPFSTSEPILKFRRGMVEMALNWSSYNVHMFCDLVSCIGSLDENHRMRIWDLIKTWAKTASDVDKVGLREKLRVTCLSNRGARKAKKKHRQRALPEIPKEVNYALEPLGLINRYAWLFHRDWVEPSYDEIHAEELNFQKRQKRIVKLRIDALRKILEQESYNGIFTLIEQGQAAWHIGWLLADKILSAEQLVTLISQAFSGILAKEASTHSKKQLIGGALMILPVEKRKKVLAEICGKITNAEMAELLLLAPFSSDNWRLVDTLNQEAQRKYWTHASPGGALIIDAERAEAVDRLLKTERPRAAFSCISYNPEKTDAKVLFHILSDIAKHNGQEQPGTYQLEEYYVRQAFQCIEESAELSLEEKAGLEFAYIDLLAQPFDQKANAIPNLEKYVEMHPEFFVQAVGWAYKRNDNGIDPPELNIEANHMQARAVNSYKLLNSLKRIPAYDNNGEINAVKLANWIKTVQDNCTELGRGGVGDESIGVLLSSAPIGSDGVWPCEAVRDAVENLHTDYIIKGMQRGVYNSRGIYQRGKDGNQERELAEKYRKWAVDLQFTHPYVSSKLLEGIAKTYESEASSEDAIGSIRSRLE